MTFPAWLRCLCNGMVWFYSYGSKMAGMYDNVGVVEVFLRLYEYSDILKHSYTRR